MNDGIETAKKCRFLILIKGKEQYFFKYDAGDELALCYTLIDYALDEQYNIGLQEILEMISREIYTKNHAVYEFPE